MTYDYHNGYDDKYDDDDRDLDLSELEDDEIFIHPSLQDSVDTSNSEYVDISDGGYLKFLKLYFSSFFARKMVSSFTKLGAENQVLCSNTNGSLLDESSSGYLVTALMTFKNDGGYLQKLYKDLLLDTSRSMYLYRVTAFISLLNKYKSELAIKRFSNTTIIGAGPDDTEIDKRNTVATLVTSQFITSNITNMFNIINEIQQRTSGDYIVIDIDMTKVKFVTPYIWCDIDTHAISDVFKPCKQFMTLVWLDGMDIPSRTEFLNKQKGSYRLQIVARVCNDKYIRYGIEYEDDNVLCTITRPNMILYPNILK